MLQLPAEWSPLMGEFVPLFSKPVWEHATILLVGAIVAPGTRTVTAGGSWGRARSSASSPLIGACIGTLVAPGRASTLAACGGHALCPCRGMGLWLG